MSRVVVKYKDMFCVGLWYTWEMADLNGRCVGMKFLLVRFSKC
jgi:hypothetical protein